MTNPGERTYGCTMRNKSPVIDTPPNSFNRLKCLQAWTINGSEIGNTKPLEPLKVSQLVTLILSNKTTENNTHYVIVIHTMAKSSKKCVQINSYRKYFKLLTDGFNVKKNNENIFCEFKLFFLRINLKNYVGI